MLLAFGPQLVHARELVDGRGWQKAKVGRRSEAGEVACDVSQCHLLAEVGCGGRDTRDGGQLALSERKSGDFAGRLAPW